MSKALSVEWFKGIRDPDQKQNFEAAIRNSTVALGRLYDLLTEWEEELNRQETTVSDFDNPNWALRQAYRAGDRARIKRVRDLMNFLKGDIRG